MIKDKNIICISSIDWDFIWQGHQEIMSTFARNGNRVLFIENTGARAPGIRDIPRIRNRLRNWFQGVKGIRKEAENLYIFSPVILPFPYSRIARKINRYLILSVLGKWNKIMNFTNPIIWVFLPTPLSLDIMDNLDAKSIIYYCIDNFRVSSVSAKKIKDSEIKLIKKSDLVFVTSQELYNYCLRYNRNVYIFPFAVNFEEFQEARLDNNLTLDELSNLRRPIIGYIGGVHKWVDLNLVKEIAKKYPEYSFVFIGPIQTDISLLSDQKNVYFLGKKEHKKIAYFIKDFDVGIIPYLITDYTKNVYPTKLNEYHAMGKPVVSTDLPEIASFNIKNDNLVLVGKSSEEFVNCISKALYLSRNNELISKRILSAQKNSWSGHIEEMSMLSENMMIEKVREPVDWKGTLIRIYRMWRRKTLRYAAAFLGVYFFLFYTPVIWFVAGPLKISQVPQKADCIVVFAGGVGESGKAGQGYEERVEYAVELYKKGYADSIMFSSGYMYIFKEPMLMKALAVSLGVPESAIILEDKAGNTYYNVMFTKEILNKKGWRRVLLVSSPYHMRRVALVAKKIAPQIEIIYTPLPHSLFYSHGIDSEGRRLFKQANLEQIEGVIHEYLGILLYWRKGWI